MKKIMKAAQSTQDTVHAVVDASFAYEAGIAALRVTFAGKDRPLITQSVLPLVASHPKYDVPLVDGAGKATSTIVLDKKHANYEACRKAVQRLVNAIVGKSAASKEDDAFEVPADVLALAKRLVKACAKYESGRKVATKALAQAFAHK